MTLPFGFLSQRAGKHGVLTLLASAPEHDSSPQTDPNPVSPAISRILPGLRPDVPVWIRLKWNALR